nr:RecB-like helicase [Campylobacter anatolicus]
MQRRTVKPFLALKASAGSGKTFALSVRFITLVLNGANANEIIALTFTKKAANEMKERIINTFLGLNSNEYEAELNTICDELDMSREEVLNLRDKRLNSFLQTNLKIGTFDSFFATILRQFSLNLGLSSDFDINSNLNSLQRIKFIKKVSWDERILRSLAEFITFAERSKSSFFESLEMFYENFDTIGGDNITKLPNTTKIDNTLAKLYEYAIQHKGSNIAINSFAPASVQELIKRGFLDHESLEYKTYTKIYTPKMDELFFELKTNLKQYFDEFEAYKLSELNKFLQIYKNTKLELNREQNMLSFGDISKLTHNLLVDNIDAQMLYFRLDGRINHLLIDEFQDTNVTQYDIMRPLIAEIVAGYGQNGLGSFFYVGDTKQSIYRFRGGKKELFDKLKSDFPQIIDDSLDTNYRSQKALVKFTNSIFASKIDDFKPQKAGVKKQGFKSVSGECEYFNVEPDDYGHLSVVGSNDIVFEAVNQVKILIQNGINVSDITILCWKNDDINKIATALELEHVPSIAEGNLALLQSPLVRAVVEYVKFCIFGDRLYQLNVQAIIKTKIIKIEINFHKSVPQTLHYLVKKLGIDGSNADILRLIELSSGYENIINFIFNLDKFDATASAKSINGVRIMTLHKSKGLQFENVIVCDKIGGDRNNKPSFVTEYSIKNGWNIKYNVARESFDSDFKEQQELIKKLEYEENINKIYVAFTRAINSLTIIKKTNPNGKNPSFFTAYETGSGGNKKLVEYLDLKEFSFGDIIPSQVQKIVKNSNFEHIELVKIAKQNIDESVRESGKNLNAIYIGLALHYLLEMSVKFDEQHLSVARDLMCNKFHKFLSQNELDDIFLRGLNLINDKKFKTLTSNKEIYKEQPFRFDGALRQLDLLCVGRSEICIIDYKTSRKNIDENILQVIGYKSAMSKIYSDFKIRSVIFYALKDEVSCIEV